MGHGEFEPAAVRVASPPANALANARAHAAAPHAHAAHAHAIAADPLKAVGGYVFSYDPLSNAVLAVSIVTAVTQAFIACSPPLSGLPLQFLVAFAAGGVLSAVFVHILPEMQYTPLSGVLVITGFLTFVSIDKAMRLLAQQPGEAGKPLHSHPHSHAPEPRTAKSAEAGHVAAGQPDDSKPSDGPQSDGQLGDDAASCDTATAPSAARRESELTMQSIGPLLNVVADSLHNLTDGISLAMAFRQSPLQGFAAFLVMCCHEIPHQFGDFALLINSGVSKAAARKLQLITALGTLTGCLLGNWLGSLGPIIDEYVTPLTAGVLLYVATQSILPELLETDADKSVYTQVGESLLQLAGIACGILLLLFLGD